MLLLHGPNEAEGGHGSGHGGMGHGEGGASLSTSTFDGFVSSTACILADEADRITLPITLLVLSALGALLSAAILKNHRGLAQAVGPSNLSFGARRNSKGAIRRGVDSADDAGVLELVGNPFTVTIVGFGVGLALAALTLPSFVHSSLSAALTSCSAQLAPLDKVVALLESITMFYIAYPAAVATGQVLLQTAPTGGKGLESIANGLRDVSSSSPSRLGADLRAQIENHPHVLSMLPPHIWQLSPSLSSTSATSPTSSTVSRRSSAPSADAPSPLIATLQVKIKHDCSDADILEVTKFCRERLATGLGQNPNLRSSHDNGEGHSEVTVSVTRAKKGEGVRFYQPPSAVSGFEKPHDEEHGHSHSHAAPSHGGHGHHH